MMWRRKDLDMPEFITAKSSMTAVINHFIVVCLVSRPLNESEAGVDLILIDTSLLFLVLIMLFSC